MAALSQGLLHVGGHGAGGFGNQPDNETRCLRVRPDPAGRAVALERRWWMTEAMSSASENPRALMRCGRRASTLWWLASARRSSAINAPKASDSITACAWSVVRPLLLTRARPAVVLGSGDDGFVFGGELSDRTPLFLFDGDGLVRGQLRTHMLKHPKQHRPAGDVGGVARMRLCSFVGPVEDHVGAVSVLAAGHRDIEVLPRARRLDQDVRRVDGDALRPVRGAGVAEVDVLSHVVGRQDDTVAEPGPPVVGS